MNLITSPPNINVPEDARGEYREMLIRLMTRQIYAETATAEVFGRAISAAPNWQEKELAAEFAAEEARHSRGLYDLLRDLGEDPEKIIAGRPDAADFWELNLDNWLDIAVFNFTVDRAGSHQIMEYRRPFRFANRISRQIVPKTHTKIHHP